MGVSKRNIDHSMVSQGGHGVCTSHLLSTTWGGRRDEETNILPRETTGSPETTGLVDEGLPLAGEVTVTGGDTEEEGVVLWKLVDGDDWVVVLWGGVHLGENFLGESLWDLEDGSLSTSSLNSSLLRLSELGYVPVHGVDDDGNLESSHCEFKVGENGIVEN